MKIWGLGDWDNGRMAAAAAATSEVWWRPLLNLRASLLALFIILVFHLFKKFYSKFLQTNSPSHSSTPTLRLPPSSSSSSSVVSPSPPPSDSQSRIPEIVSDSDLKFLIDNLEEKLNDGEKWENVIDKTNNFLSYRAKCCKTKDKPVKYLSTTVFEGCSPELLKDFYMDNDYRKQWDKTVLDHMQLQMDRTNGIEVGRTIKKFPLLTPREYVLAWKLWEGKDRTFYCFIKECEHPSAPRQKKYVRVGYFRSGWQIRKVPGRNASEIRMFHQEDAGLNVEMAKLAFAKGIWSYVCKMDDALRKYSVISHPLTGTAVSAATLIQKVPPELDINSSITSPTVSASMAIHERVDAEPRARMLSRRPSKKLVAKSLLVLGGVICLSRGHSTGAKVAMAYILTKLRKRGDSSSQGRQG